MCGRYRLSQRKQLIQEYFDTADEVDWEPRYRGCYETREAQRAQGIFNIREIALRHRVVAGGCALFG
jgi:putative SOS response-associated peptidase YedK